ncbi:MAG: carbohydrate binding family 9 domain-containing protein [Flavobacteriaceae bacterium]|nr:carbohydrate binding family 9 domain-containing protein [Flavobacteriaceae bacterium]
MTINNAPFWVLFLVPLIAFSQNNNSTTQDSTAQVSYEKRIYTTASIAGTDGITIDGVLDEAAWDVVEWTTDYVEFEPDVGTPPTEQTKMKIAYDDKNLYVAFKCYQADPSTIEKRMGRRDDFPGDWVEINIDSYNDDRSGFSFTASASGVKGDEFISNNGNWDGSWNPIWYLSTRIDDDGWTAEFRIPLSQLRFGNDEEQEWGIQSTRRYFRNEERSLWQPLPANPPGWVSEFGILKGIKGIKPQKQLEIQPYTVAQLDTFEEEPGNPFRDGSNTNFTGGLDAKIGITNDLTLDLTVNPDFGQVDADPGAIALDGFEIFFQERRPFFVENKNVFDFRVGGGSDNLFFSRRIGRSPQGFTSADGSRGEFQDIPINTTILGAAKFSGKTKNGLSIGALQSITDKEYAKIELDTRQDVLDNIDEVGEEREELVEPLTSYSVLRLQQDFNDNNSFIGGIATYTHRNIEGNLDFLREKAFSGGVDFRHNWKERRYYATGKFVASTVSGSAESIELTQRSLTHLFQRTDAGHVSVDPTRTSLTGSGGSFEVGKGGGGNWRYNIGGNFRSPELELNDIGFLRQADQITQYANIRRLWNKPTSWFRQANVGVNQFTQYDFDGNYNRIQYEINGYVNWKNNWWSEAGFGHKPRIFSNTVLRGGPRWRWNDENFVFLFSGTDGRKKFSMHAGYVYSSATQNNFSFQRYVLRFFYQPLNTLSLSLINEFEVNPNKTQYVTETDFNGTPRYILGEIDNESLSTTLRVNYNINPNLTIQYYGQPFIFKAKFSNFNYVNDPVASDLNERVTWFDDNQISFSGEDGAYLIDEDRNGETDYSFGDPDFAFVQFRSNLVLRWEYIPGSEIFLVWSQGITGLGDVNNDFGEIIDNQLLGARPQNTFLIKATYRFVL